jgi:hypothetical protein
MKNQKGFVVPLLIGIIVILISGGGLYFYSQKKSEDLSKQKVSDGNTFPVSEDTKKAPAEVVKNEDSSRPNTNLESENILEKLKKSQIKFPTDKIFTGDLNGDGSMDAIYTLKSAGEPGGYLYAIVDKVNVDGSAKIFVDIAPFMSISKIQSLSIDKGVISMVISPGGIIEEGGEYNKDTVTRKFKLIQGNDGNYIYYNLEVIK